jgi:hypothetical protein
MIYLAAAIAALVIGLIATRKISAIFLEQLHQLWLLIPAVVFFTAPYLIVLIRPELLTADNHQLLKMLILLSHGLLILLLLINLIVQAAGFFRSGTSEKESSENAAAGNSFIKKMLRGLLVLSLVVLMGAVVAHGLVLYANDGMMPVSQDYLTGIEDPVLAEGIQNDALYFKRLIKEDTQFANLGQIVQVPWLTALMPPDYFFISWPEIIMAVGIFTTVLLSMLLDRAVALPTGRKSKKSEKPDPDSGS